MQFTTLTYIYSMLDKKKGGALHMKYKDHTGYNNWIDLPKIKILLFEYNFVFFFIYKKSSAVIPKNRPRLNTKPNCNFEVWNTKN